MKLYALYHPHSDHARSIEEFVHDFARAHNYQLELLSLETREGAAAASLYDVMEYPAILALADDGRVMQTWTGAQLPLMNEVAAFLNG